MKIIYDFENLKDFKQLTNIYKKYGIVCIKNFFKNDATYNAYNKDLKKS